MPRPTLTADTAQARALLRKFSPARPFIASPALYERMAVDPDLSDLMDRVVVSAPAPPAPSRRPALINRSLSRG